MYIEGRVVMCASVMTFQLFLNRRWSIGVSKHWVEASGKVVGHTTSIVILRGGHQGSYPKH